MASSSHRLLLRLSILLGLLAIAANARPGRHFHPCKTLIFFSTSSYSLSALDQNPNFSLQDPSSSSSSGGRFLTFIFTEVRELDPKPTLPSYETVAVDRSNIDGPKRPLSVGFYSSVGGTKDTLARDLASAVGAMFFGVGCGALTAATMYLVWSLFAQNRFEFRDSDDEDDYDDNDVSPKKMGYVAIPAAATPVSAPLAKEVI